jgi:hypothetical protein
LQVLGAVIVARQFAPRGVEQPDRQVELGIRVELFRQPDARHLDREMLARLARDAEHVDVDIARDDDAALYGGVRFHRQGAGERVIAALSRLAFHHQGKGRHPERAQHRQLGGRTKLERMLAQWTVGSNHKLAADLLIRDAAVRKSQRLGRRHLLEVDRRDARAKKDNLTWIFEMSALQRHFNRRATLPAARQSRFDMMDHRPGRYRNS